MAVAHCGGDKTCNLPGQAVQTGSQKARETSPAKDDRLSASAAATADLDHLNNKIEKLTNVVSSVLPIVKQIQATYEDSLIDDKEGQRDSQMSESEGSDYEERIEPTVKKTKTSSTSDSSEKGVLESLIFEVTGKGKTIAALTEKNCYNRRQHSSFWSKRRSYQPLNGAH